MKTYKIKNWNEHQHYKHRFPPWIKLQVSLLDNPKFDELTGDEVKFLIKIWLAATRNKTIDGVIPNVDKLSFVIRLEKSQTKKYLEKLEQKGWIELCV